MNNTLQVIDSLKNVVDSLQTIQDNNSFQQAFQIVSEIDELYNNRFTILTIIFVLVGAVIPLIINYVQKQAYKTKVLEFDSKILAYKQDLERQISEIQQFQKQNSLYTQAMHFVDRVRYDDFDNKLHPLTFLSSALYLFSQAQKLPPIDIFNLLAKSINDFDEYEANKKIKVSYLETIEPEIYYYTESEYSDYSKEARKIQELINHIKKK